MRKFIIIGLIIFLGVIAFAVRNYQQAQQILSIQSFAECKKAGYPVMESFPERCMTPDGRSFTDAVHPQQITVTGEFVCLPHKNTGGEQTLECAIGIVGDDGVYYSIDDSHNLYTNISGVGTGKKVTVEGTFVSRDDQKYTSAGVITLKKLSEVPEE